MKNTKVKFYMVINSENRIFGIYTDLTEAHELNLKLNAILLVCDGDFSKNQYILNLKDNIKEWNQILDELLAKTNRYKDSMAEKNVMRSEKGLARLEKRAVEIRKYIQELQNKLEKMSQPNTSGNDLVTFDLDMTDF